MKIFKAILPILGALDPTGIINMVRPKDISGKTGIAEDIVRKVIDAIKADPAMEQARMDHAEVMARISSANLRGLDTDASYSVLKGLLGSPRRLAVTVLTMVLAFLGAVVGVRAVFMDIPIADPAAFADILKMLGGTLVGVGGAYGIKYLGKNGR